ncbi:hypothetical protein J7M23_08175 [Candidatus Sumerlaeota bacterium]|nr:hypothetical protein [Candidatus Sumerlaeota bacterium]
MTQTEVTSSLLQRLLDDPIFYIETLLYVVNKKGELVPFFLNKIQQRILKQKERILRSGRSPRYIILKYRRGGVTTLEQAINFYYCATRLHYNAWTLAHTVRSTEEIFRIALRFYDHLPGEFRPARKRENKRELNFCNLDSKFQVTSAQAEEPIRGTQINRFHGSEIAFWKDAEDVLLGVQEAMTPGGEIVLESTPNGTQNWFYEEIQRILAGASEYSLIFLPWYVDPANQLPVIAGEEIELTKEEQVVQRKYHLSLSQIKWRRQKILELREKFWQEYPESLDDCFLMRKGRVYEEFIEKGENPNVIEPFEIPPDWEIYGGIDFGVTNPFVYLLIAIRPTDNAAIVFYEHYKSNERLRNHAKAIKKINTKHPPRIIWADPSGRRERIELLTEYDIKTYPGDNNVIRGIDLIKWLLGSHPQTGKPLLYVMANCAHTIREFKNYRWDESKEKPIKEDDHTMDALRYVIMGIYTKWRRERRKTAWFDYYDREVEGNE